MEKELTAYFIGDGDCEGICIISSSRNKAKAIGAKELGMDYIDVASRLMKKAVIKKTDTEGMVILGEDGIRRGVYGWIEDGECDKCKKVCTTVYNVDKIPICSDCQEKQ